MIVTGNYYKPAMKIDFVIFRGAQNETTRGMSQQTGIPTVPLSIAFTTRAAGRVFFVGAAAF